MLFETSSRTKPTLVSVVLPVTENIVGLNAAQEQLSLALPGISVEGIFVLGGGTPDLATSLEDLHRQDPDRVQYVLLTRRAEFSIAAAVGIAFSQGDCVVVLGNLQRYDPGSIAQIVQRWMSGDAIVACNRREGAHIRRPGRLWLSATAMISKRLVKGARNLDLRTFLVDSQFRTLVSRLRLRNSNLLLELCSVGHPVAFISVEPADTISRQEAREDLESSVNALFSVSYAPIRLISIVGICSAFLGFVYAVSLLYAKLTNRVPIEGYASTAMTILVFSGVSLIMLGVLAEYLWRAYEQLNTRPEYFIKSGGVEQ